MKKFLPFIIAILFLGTAISLFLSANITSTDFETDFYEKIYPTDQVMAMRTYQDGIYRLEIQQALPQLETGEYRGWLVRLSPFKIIDLGTFQNGYLKYEVADQETDYKTFTEVIITVEFDSNPTIPSENQVVIGSFNN